MSIFSASVPPLPSSFHLSTTRKSDSCFSLLSMSRAVRTPSSSSKQHAKSDSCSLIIAHRRHVRRRREYAKKKNNVNTRFSSRGTNELLVNYILLDYFVQGSPYSILHPSQPFVRAKLLQYFVTKEDARPRLLICETTQNAV